MQTQIRQQRQTCHNPRVWQTNGQTDEQNYDS